MIKKLIGIGMPHTLLMGLSGILAASAASLSVGHVDWQITFVFAIVVALAQLVSNYCENYVVTKRMEENRSRLFSASNINLAYIKVLRETLVILTLLLVTLGLFLVAIGNMFILIPAAIVVLVIYFNSVYTIPLGRTWWGIIFTFLCFGPIEILTCYCLQNFSGTEIVVPMVKVSNLLSVSVLVGLMAVNTLLIFIYSSREQALDTNTPTIARRSRLKMVLWFYFVNSLLIAVISFLQVYVSEHSAVRSYMFLLPFLSLAVYLSIWIRLPLITSFEQSKRLQLGSMSVEFVYFLIVLIARSFTAP